MSNTSQFTNTMLAALLALLAGAGTTVFVSDGPTAEMNARLGLVATLLLPFLFGYFIRRHAWVWGFLVIFGQLLVLPVVEAGDHSQAPLGLYVYAVLLPAAILSGVLGAWLSRKASNRRSTA